MTVAGARLSLPQPAHTATKIEQAASQFESILLGVLLERMQDSAKDFGNNHQDLAQTQYTEFASQALAAVWAARGGIGIARMITSSLQKTAVTSK